ncbi:hypothetical protein D1872_315550 [compost metagenome]
MAITINGDSMFGRTVPQTIRVRLAPLKAAAATYSFCRSDMTKLLAMRAYLAHQTTDSAMTV